MRKIASLGMLLMFVLLCLVQTLSTSFSAEQKAKSVQTSVSPNYLFANNCAKCHGKDGRAKTFRGKLLGARNLTDPQWQASASDERLFNSITNGRGKMPAFGKKFSETEINSLVQFVRHLKK